MAGCLTDVTSHSVPDYALYEQNPRQGWVSPDPRRGWGGGQAARGQRRGSAAWRRTRGRASLQGVSFGARVSELRGAPNRSAASQRGPLTPPPGLPGTRPAGTPLPGPDVAPPTELPREPQPLPPASPPPPGCSFRFQKGIYCRSFWARGSGGGSARTLGVAIRAERSGPRLPRGDFAQQPEGNAVLIGTGARRESGHTRPRVVFRMLGETGSERPQPLRVRARVTSTPGRPEARGPVLPAEAPAPTVHHTAHAGPSPPAKIRRLLLSLNFRDRLRLWGVPRPQNGLLSHLHC